MNSVMSTRIAGLFSRVYLLLTSDVNMTAIGVLIGRTETIAGKFSVGYSVGTPSSYTKSF